MKNAQLRQLRQREAQLWQQATESVRAKHLSQAETELKQVEALPDGGVHREDAQRYLVDVIPQLKLQGKLLTEARRSLQQVISSRPENLLRSFRRAGATRAS